MSTGSVIRIERQRLDMSQAELGDRLGVTAGAVSHWESDRSTPRVEMMQTIADFFEVNFDYLSTGGMVDRISGDAQQSESFDHHIQQIKRIVAKNNSVPVSRVCVEIRITSA